MSPKFDQQAWETILESIPLEGGNMWLWLQIIMEFDDAGERNLILQKMIKDCSNRISSLNPDYDYRDLKYYLKELKESYNQQ